MFLETLENFQIKSWVELSQWEIRCNKFPVILCSSVDCQMIIFMMLSMLGQVSVDRNWDIRKQHQQRSKFNWADVMHFTAVVLYYILVSLINLDLLISLKNQHLTCRLVNLGNLWFMNTRLFLLHAKKNYNIVTEISWVIQVLWVKTFWILL